LARDDALIVFLQYYIELGSKFGEEKNGIGSHEQNQEEDRGQAKKDAAFHRSQSYERGNGSHDSFFLNFGCKVKCRTPSSGEAEILIKEHDFSLASCMPRNFVFGYILIKKWLCYLKEVYPNAGSCKNARKSFLAIANLQGLFG
jgi:hypothetical protein